MKIGMRIGLLLISLLGTACQGSAENWLVLSATDPMVRYEGRTQQLKGGEVVFAWSGTGVRVRFQGTALDVRMVCADNYFQVWVDGREDRLISCSHDGADRYVLAENLPPGEHEVAFYKRTEPAVGTVVIQEFLVQGERAAEPPQELTGHRIEFVGNSITCGYGVLDSAAEHGFKTETEDYSRTAMGVAARALEADYRMVCYSAHGIYRNNDGSSSELLPVLYKLVIPGQEAVWNFSAWKPELIAIDLGTNDFYSGPPDSSGFVNATVAFVKELVAHYPQAKVLLLDGPMLNDFYPLDSSGKPYASLTICRRYLDAAALKLQANGMAVARLSMTLQGERGYGADYHPNQAQSVYNGAELTQGIKTFMGW